MDTVKVMLVDDHAMVREGLKQLLELDGEIKVIEEASDGEECLQKLRTVRPDVLLLDINMPVMNGIDVLKELKRKKKKVKVLILTIHNEVEYLVKAVDIGIKGYVLKDSPYETLKEAILAVNRGETFIESSLAPSLNAEFREKREKLSDSELTRREKEVLCLLAEGMYNKEIASKLEISEKTVKNHVSSIFKKISVSDRTQAAVYAIKKNLVKI